MLSFPRAAALAVVGLMAGLIAGCGGGSGALDDDPSAASVQPLAYTAASRYRARCAAPRPAGTINPASGRPYGDKAGSLELERYWLRSWIDETYLWYREVPKTSPKNYFDPVDYFEVLKTTKQTGSGKPKDRFHFTSPTEEWNALSESNRTIGYGMQVMLVSPTPPRRAVVAYVTPGTPAAAQSIRRGTEIVEVDGADLVEGDDIDTLNTGLFPQSAGRTHRFVVRDGGKRRSIRMKSAAYSERSVLRTKVLSTATGKVGYLLFNDHMASAESQLVAAVRRLKAEGPIRDLVLDLRYNGGGYVAIASQLAYMIAGPKRTAGKTFETLVYNSKNPFAYSRADRTLPFLDETQGISLKAGRALPTLSLSRVFVLTGAGTCSASEAIINGLRGIDVEVIQIGETTCGKPYGFHPTDNCGTTYFAVQFAGRNAKGFGSYADGFVPGGGGRSGVRGCRVPDDYSRALGDSAERRLAAALRYRASGTCSGDGAAERDAHALQAPAGAEPVLVRSPLRENRYLPEPAAR